MNAQTPPNAGFAKSVSVLLTLVSLCAQTLLAQTPAATPSSGSLLQTIPDSKPMTKEPAKLQDMFRGAPPISDVEGLKVTVSGYRFTGLTVMPQAELQGRVGAFTGPDRKFQDLLDAASTAGAALVEKGYFLADVLIPVQALKDSVVELVVLEGRLGRTTVAIAPDAGVSEHTVRRYLAQLIEGNLLTTAAVERVIFLLGDLKGINVTYNFSPGQMTGTADLNVRVTRSNKFGGGIDADMNGSIYTGTTRLSAAADINNLFGQGDFLNFKVLGSTRSDSQHLLSKDGLIFNRLSYLTPVGASGTKIGTAYSVLRYELGREFALLKPAGDAKVKSLVALHPFVRARNLNVIGSMQFDIRDFEDRQDAVQQRSHNRTQLVTLTLGGDLRDDFGRGGTTTFALSGTRGKLSIFDENDAQADAGTLKSAGNYHKFNVTLTRLQRFIGQTTLYGSVVRQFAGKNLNTSEKLSLGGPNGVRAYPQGEGVGDEGYIANLELRAPLPLEPLKVIPGSAVLVAFVDYGSSRTLKRPYQPSAPNFQKISGVGVGLNWGLGDQWSLRSSLAWRQGRAPTSETVDHRPRVFLQLSKLF